MKKIILTLLLLTIAFSGYCQNDFIQIETNKTLSLFSFLETASDQRGISLSFKEYINKNTIGNTEFQTLIEEYSILNLDYQAKRDGYPDSRYIYLHTKDLIWIAASNSTNISDFSTRIIGILPHETHIRLIRLLNQIEPFYDDLVWNDAQQNIQRIESQLEGYKDEIGELFLKISKFYRTKWHKEMPFKISLYPIPLEKGHTTAVPKGNVLICSVLSQSEDEYLSTLGVIIHEMCHILYREQSIEVQHEIDKWFSNNTSDYNNLAYSYINEGLATVLGNGWAYKQLHGSLDTSEWYNNTYIDGFARVLYPLTKQFLFSARMLDSSYVKEAINLFEQKFPKAIYDTNILMTDLVMYANTEEQKEIDLIRYELRKKFRVISLWFSTPILDEQSIQNFKKEKTTKLFIIDSKHKETLQVINSHFVDFNFAFEMNSFQTFFDKESKSNVIVIILDNINSIGKGFDTLSKVEFLDKNVFIKIE